MMCNRKSPWELVRRLLAAGLFALAIGSFTEAQAGLSSVPKKSIVKVVLRSQSSGIMVQGRYLPGATVQELVELNGFVGSDGYVIGYAGWYLQALEASDVEIHLSVKTHDGKAYPAKLAAVDERLSLMYLKTPLPRDLAVAFSDDSLPKEFSIAVRGENDWKVARPCVEETSELSWLPVLEVKLSNLEPSDSWTGGPVFDGKGRLAGVVTEASAHPFSNQAVCEIIPARLVKKSFQQIRESGESIRVGWLGVFLDEVDKLPVITQVMQSSPAAMAGLQARDAITEVDGRPMSSLKEFGRAVRSRQPGKTVNLTLIREGEKVATQVALGTRQHMYKTGWRMDLPSILGSEKGPMRGLRLYRSVLPPLVDLGLVLDPVPAQLGRKLNSPNGGGLLVKEVGPGTSAQKSGFAAGDVIFMINGKDVFTIEDVQKCLEAAQKGPVEVRLVRDRKIQTLKVYLQ